MQTPRWAVWGAAGAVTPALLSGFGMSPGLALLGGIGVAALGLRRGSATALLLVASLAISLVLYALVLNATGLDEAIYYRPHERYATWDSRWSHRAYQPRVSVRMDVPHGDLQGLTRAEIAEPRPMRFATDGDGFRNDADYAGEPWVLLGDSFVAGNGTSQEHLLPARLAARGVRAVNRGFPGGITDYEQFWRSFRSRHDGARALLFLFEGNDFPENADRREVAPWRAAMKRRVRDATAGFRRLPTSRVTRSLAARVAHLGAIRGGDLVAVHRVADRPLAFYLEYVKKTRREQLPEMTGFDAAFARLAPDLDAVFFIPTKYRVYQRWVAPEEDLPHASWRHLAASCREQGVPCVDLTAALRTRSESLLREGRFTWWRDDTHWNGAGIDAAAERVAETLAALEARQ